jgi:TRAP-type C4-dicarboxylate transport system substrate-binding protein
MINSDWGKAQFRQLATARSMQMVGPAWYYGTRQLTTRDRAVRVPADARGLKIRVPAVPTFLEMIRAIGATPTPMALAEVYLSLQTGVCDGQENPLPTIAAQKFYEVQRFLNLTGHIITPQICMMNAEKYNALSDADKTAVNEAFAAGGQVNDQKFRDMEGSLIADFRQRGMTIVESDRPAFQEAMAPVYPRFEETWGRGVADQLRAIR